MTIELLETILFEAYFIVCQLVIKLNKHARWMSVSENI